MMAATTKENVNDAKVMSKGQVTISKNVRETLEIDVGGRVAFIVDGADIRLMSSSVYAMKRLQKQMKREAAKAGFTSEEDVAK